MILRLAVRSLAVRPWRTAVLAAGFGLGIGVMVALLGVGEVIIEQAHSPALRGGGDLLITGVFGPIESARFVLSNVIGSPRLRPQTIAVSPTRRATVYLIKPGAAPIAIAARGGVPSLERAVGDPEAGGVAAWTDEPADAAWSNPPADVVLRAIDRFHPVPALPASSSAVATRGFGVNSWAEWLYFNGRTTDGRLRFYLTFLAGAPNADGRRVAVVRLQLDRDGRSTNYSAAAIVDHAALVAAAPDLDIAGNRVRVEGSSYRLTLSLERERSADSTGRPAAAGSHLDGEFVLDVPAGRSLPPTEIHGAHGWVSGYVVPVLSGPIRGQLRVGGETVALDGATGYHDHNWGFWEGVRWQWGQVAGGDVSIVYGRVFPPDAVADPDRVPGFLGVLGPDGPIGFSSNVSITEDNSTGTPTEISVHAQATDMDVRMTMAVEESIGTRMALTQLQSGETMNFLQLGGAYRVDGRIGQRRLVFSARGSAETFRAR